MAARAECHEEFFVVGSAGKDGDDVVAVVLSPSTVSVGFPAHFAFGLFVSGVFGDLFPWFIGEEGANCGVYAGSAFPVGVIFSGAVFGSVLSLAFVVAVVSWGVASVEFGLFSCEWGSAVGAFALGGVFGVGVRVVA